MLPSYRIDRPSCRAKSAQNDQHPYFQQQAFTSPLYHLPPTEDVYGLQRRVDIQQTHQLPNPGYLQSVDSDTTFLLKNSHRPHHQTQLSPPHLDLINQGYRTDLHHPRSCIHQNRLVVWRKSFCDESSTFRRAMEDSVHKSSNEDQTNADGHMMPSGYHKRGFSDDSNEGTGEMAYKRPRVATPVENIPLPDDVNTAARRPERRGEYEVLDLSVRCSPPQSHQTDYFGADLPMHGYAGTPVYSYRSVHTASTQPTTSSQPYQHENSPLSMENAVGQFETQSEYCCPDQQNANETGNNFVEKQNANDAALYLTKELEDIDFTTMKSSTESSHELTMSNKTLTIEENEDSSPTERNDGGVEEDLSQEKNLNVGDFTKKDDKKPVEKETREAEYLEERDKCNTPLIDESDNDETVANEASRLVEINDERCDTPCLDEIPYVEHDLQLSTPPCEESSISSMSAGNNILIEQRQSIETSIETESTSDKERNSADITEDSCPENVEQRNAEMIPITVFEEIVCEEVHTSATLDNDVVTGSSASSLEVEAACNALIDHLQNEPSSSVEPVITEHVENVITENVEEVITENVETIITENIEEVVTENVEVVITENVDAKGIDNIVPSENVEKVIPAKDEAIITKNVENIIPENVEEVVLENGENVIPENTENVISKSSGNVMPDEVMTEVVCKNMEEITPEKNYEVVGKNTEHIISENDKNVTHENGKNINTENVENIIRDNLDSETVHNADVTRAEVQVVEVKETVEDSEYEMAQGVVTRFEKGQGTHRHDTGSHQTAVFEHSNPPELLMVDPRLLIELPPSNTLSSQRDPVTACSAEDNQSSGVSVSPKNQNEEKDCDPPTLLEMKRGGMPTDEKRAAVLTSLFDTTEKDILNNDVDITTRSTGAEGLDTSQNNENVKFVAAENSSETPLTSDATFSTPSKDDITVSAQDEQTAACHLDLASLESPATISKSILYERSLGLGDTLHPSVNQAPVETRGRLNSQIAVGVPSHIEESKASCPQIITAGEDDIGSLPIVQLAMKSAEEITQKDAGKPQSPEKLETLPGTTSGDLSNPVSEVCIPDTIQKLCNEDQPSSLIPDGPGNLFDTLPDQLTDIPPLQNTASPESTAASVEQNVDPPTLDFIAMSEAFDLPTEGDIVNRVSPDDTGPPSLIPMGGIKDSSCNEEIKTTVNDDAEPMETDDTRMEDDDGNAVILDYSTFCQMHPNEDGDTNEEENNRNTFASDLRAAYDGADIDQLKDTRTHQALSALDRLSEQLTSHESEIPTDTVTKVRKARRKRRKSPYTRKPNKTSPPQPRAMSKRPMKKKSALERLHQTLNMDLVFYAHESSDDDDEETETQISERNDPISASTLEAAKSHQHTGGRHTRRSCELCTVKRRIMHGSIKHYMKRDYSEKSPTKTSSKNGKGDKDEDQAETSNSEERVTNDEVEIQTTPVKELKVNVYDASPAMNGKDNVNDLPLAVAANPIVKRKRGRPKKKVTFSLSDAEASAPDAKVMPTKEKISSGIARFKEKIKGLKQKSLEKSKSSETAKKKKKMVDVAVGPDEPMAYLDLKPERSSRGYRVKSKKRSKGKHRYKKLCWFDVDGKLQRRLYKSVIPDESSQQPEPSYIDPYSSYQEAGSKSSREGKSLSQHEKKRSRDRPTVGNSPTLADKSMDVFTFRDEETITNTFPSPPHSPSQQQSRGNVGTRDASDLGTFSRPTRILQPKRRKVEAAAGAPLKPEHDNAKTDDTAMMSDEVRTAITAAVLDIRPAHRAQIKRRFKFRERLTYSKYKKDSKIHSHQEERVMRLKKQLQSQMMNLDRIKVRETKRRIPKSVKHLMSQEDGDDDDDDDYEDYGDDVGYDDDVHLGSIDEDGEGPLDQGEESYDEENCNEDGEDQVEKGEDIQEEILGDGGKTVNKATVDDLVEFEEFPPEEGVDDRVAAEHALKFRRRREKPVKQYDIKLFEPI